MTYQVSANTGAARSASISAAGKTHTVNQAAPAITCTYGLPTHNGVFDPAGGNGSFQVNTNDPSCSWTVNSDDNWLLITNGSNHTGSASVAFLVDANDTPHQRVGTITVTGVSGGFTDTFTVTQNHPWIPVNFTWDIFAPEIGETVTFTTDERLEVLSWSFTSGDCEGNPPVITCDGTAGTCNEVEWTWADAGVKEVVLITTTDTMTKGLTVKTTGECPPFCGKDGPPDASFVVTPSPALEDEEITFTDTSSGGLKILTTGLTWTPNEPGDRSRAFTSASLATPVTSAPSGTSARTGATLNRRSRSVSRSIGDCHDSSFTFASGGNKTVSVVVKDFSGTDDPGHRNGDGSGSERGLLSRARRPAPIPSIRRKRSFTAEGGSLTIDVNTQAGCTWTATTVNSWITLTQPTSGTGNGSVT